MSDCSARDGYLDRTLGAEATQAFEAHAASCAACQAAVAQWQTFGASLKEAYAPLSEAPLPGELARLKGKVSTGRARRPLGWALGAAAAVAVVVGVALALRAPPEVVWEAAVVASVQTTASAELAQTGAAGGALFSLGEDEVGLGPATKVKFKRAGSRGTELELLSGVLAAKVNAHGKRPFDIVTPRGRIHVVGTMFRVQAGEQLEVEVLEGVVEVTDRNGKVERVKAGHRWAEAGGLAPFASTGFVELQIPAVLDAGATVAAAVAAAADAGEPRDVPRPAVRSPVAEWRSRAARGECAAVVGELERYLRATPGSADGWLLLGDCRRREGGAKEAVEAYLRATKSRDADGERGLLLAASLLQDELSQPAQALKLLDQYLARKPETPELEAAALVRKGRAFASLGKKENARAIYSRVIGKFGDTPAAAEASRLRDGL
ncbi:MAG: FecR protein [Myxococcaceae bacterium]|nr:FecR protein [Myxococcaceae bacterium]